MAHASTSASADILDVLRLVCGPGDVHELRCLNTPKGTVSGNFSDLGKMAEAAARWSGKAESVYLTLNPINPDLLARADNRCKEYARSTTADVDIVRRDWLLIDFDPVRPAGISSTDAEHEAALERAQQCHQWLTKQHGWNDSLYVADSGNGAHLLARIDLLNDEPSKILLQKVLERIAQRFNDAAVTVDKTTFNAARICTLYGTLKAKGDSTETRPHRLARMITDPDDENGPGVLAHCLDASELEEFLADTEVAQKPRRPKKPELAAPPLTASKLADIATYTVPFENPTDGGGPFDMEAYIFQHELVTRPAQPHMGGTRWQMDCLFNESHRAPDAALFVTPSGAAAYKCSHNSCSGNDWHALRDKLEPGWREAREERQQKRAASTEAAKEIPIPAHRDSKGAPEYAAGQIVEILECESWGVSAMDTHAAHAHRIITALGKDLAFTPSIGWLVWNGRFWDRDDKDDTLTVSRVAAISQLVVSEAGKLYGAAAHLARAGRVDDAAAMGKAAKAHLKHAQTTESTPFIKATLTQAAGKLRIDVALLEPKPWIFGMQNGVWDHGAWREHRREDWMTGLSPIDTSSCGNDEGREWFSVLDRITGRDDDFAHTLQDVVAYAMSGASHLRMLPWLYGPKGSGKSTIAELTMTILGPMATTIEPKYLSEHADRERLGAVLWGKRLLVCAEAGRVNISAEVLKTLSGGDSYPVRFLYREAFQANPSHALLFAGNDPPNMTAWDDALHDRILTLPCTHSLSEPEPLQLTGSVRIEAIRKDPKSALVQGFALWALGGLDRLYQRQAIHVATVVQDATADFWAETNPLTGFWQSIPETSLREGIERKVLRERYSSWAGDEGITKLFGPKALGLACKAEGLTLVKRDGFYYWIRRNAKSSENEKGQDQGKKAKMDPDLDNFSYERKISHKRYSNQSQNLPLLPQNCPEMLEEGKI